MEESRFVLVWDLPVEVEVGVLKEVLLVSCRSVFRQDRRSYGAGEQGRDKALTSLRAFNVRRLAIREWVTFERSSSGSCLLMEQ